MPREQRTLRKRERNDVHDEIVRLELDRAQYVWGQRSSGATWNMIDSLEHEPTGSYFTIGVSGDGTFYYTECDPGWTAQVEREGGQSWPEVIAQLRKWLKRISEDEGEPDRWAELEAERGQLASVLEGMPALDSPLSKEDRDRVAEHLAWMRDEVVLHHDLTPEQVVIFDAHLGEIESAASLLTRKHFLNYVIGATISIGLYLALPAEAQGALFRATVSVVTNLFRGVAELSQPPIS